jgi:hypothetical protein
VTAGSTAGSAPEPRAANVVEAITRVIRDMPAVTRDARAPEEHGGYAYRAVDDITAHVGPLLARHGVVFVPCVETVDIRDVMIDQTPWTDTVVTVRYRICGPGGLSDVAEAVVVGIGRDDAGKGAAKAMTAAFKYVLLQTFCIGDRQHDADCERAVADAHVTAPRDAINDLVERIRTTSPQVAAQFKTWKRAERVAWPWSEAAIAQMHAKLDALSAPAARSKPATPFDRAASTAPGVGTAGDGGHVAPH